MAPICAPVPLTWALAAVTATSHLPLAETDPFRLISLLHLEKPKAMALTASTPAVRPVRTRVL